MKKSDLIENIILLYKSGRLEEYIKQLEPEDLNNLDLTLLLENNYDNNVSKILSLISKEKQRRTLLKVLDQDTSEFINNEFNVFASRIKTKNLYNSVNYLAMKDIDFSHLIKWCPAMMDIEQVYEIYNYLKQLGYDDKHILEIISADVEKMIYFDQIIKSKDKSSEDIFNDKNFEKFIMNSSKFLKESKSGTESYKKIIEHEMKNYDDVLRKLQ